MRPLTTRITHAVTRADYIMGLARIGHYMAVQRALVALAPRDLFDIIVILSSDLVVSGYDPQYDDTYATHEEATRGN